MSRSIDHILRRGVRVSHPDSVFIGDDVRPDNIAPGVWLGPGTRLAGATTSIGPGCVISAEQPVTLADCQLGRDVQLAGGFFAGSVFWDGVRCGSASHVRPGCLLEEQSSTAHAVGLKQTILFPFVTLGSLINFCDVLMAGGGGPDNHSEVGSSYVHFNYTPQHDKATASMLGNVPWGVLLNQPPIFLGGQGGLVGPRRLAFGTTIAAGVICRKDVPQAGTFIAPEPSPVSRRPTSPVAYGKVVERFRACMQYLGQLRALTEWYRHARPLLAPADVWCQQCVAGGVRVLQSAWVERIQRLAEWIGKFPASMQHLRAAAEASGDALREQAQVAANWPSVASHLQRIESTEIAVEERRRCLALLACSGDSYIRSVQSLPPAACDAARQWLGAVVTEVAVGFHEPSESC